MFSKVNSLGLFGMSAELVEVEVDLSSGLPRFDLVGLPDSAVSEARERVRSAIKSCGFDFPISRITVNLAPAEFKKEGPIYDLPILIAILIASKQLRVPKNISDCALLGEISLDGRVRRINGVLPMTIKARSIGLKRIFVPQDNAVEAALISGIDVYPVQTLQQLIKALTGAEVIPRTTQEFALSVTQSDRPSDEPDFADIIGQESAKRALEVAAAGGHHVLMTGSPGSGKSMLAKCLPSILPDMSFEETVETTAIYSVAGILNKRLQIVNERPFRAPHHTATEIAVSGGGRKAQPGEISLAHNGVLFLDELPMFKRIVLETLRQPLEDGEITITRSTGSATYPAKIMLICAMNPCPCGYLLDPVRECVCTEAAKKWYSARISGPLFDRMDIALQVDPLDCELLINNSDKSSKKRETSAEIKRRVNSAREIQRQRFKGTSISCNAHMPPRLVRQYCKMTPEAKAVLIGAFKTMGFSARVNDKILRTARTIADLNGNELISIEDISEAIQYRTIDRLYNQK